MKKKQPTRRNQKLAVLLGGAVVSATVWGAILGGCVEQPSSITTPAGPTGGDPTGGAGGSDAGSAANKAEALFKAIEPELVKTCGVCHEPGGLADTPFLAAPDRYQSVASWPGIVVKDPDKSLFLTYSVKGGGHSGTNLDADTLDPTLVTRVQDWLAEEAKAIAEPPPDVGPAIDPFVPIMGFNAVYLGPLGADFEGMAITFNANELGSQSLELTQIEVHTTKNTGVHLVHPLFVVFPVGAEADPDPIDSFSNIDQSFEAGTGGELGPGTAILTNWKTKAKLTIAFEKIEKIATGMNDGGMDGGTSGCKDVGAFMANAQAQFAQRCNGCHGGGNAAAQGAVDMSELNSDPASACAQIRFRVKPSEPPASQIFITTTPGGNAAHPFKFGGDADNFNAFKNAVTPWIAAEN
jgi:mono/diheme cytochrome c family protein